MCYVVAHKDHLFPSSTLQVDKCFSTVAPATERVLGSNLHLQDTSTQTPLPATGGSSSESCSSLTAETVVSPVISVNELPEEVSLGSGHVSPPGVPLSADGHRPSASFSSDFFRLRGQEAGLSQRAADFAASSLRASTRTTYDSRLAGFIEWCSRSSTDPSSASLGCIADFLLSLFDKDLSISTIRGYRSAIASSHRGFADGSTVSNSLFISKLLKAFFLKRPPCRSLVPSWSLPSVLRCLAEAPFEPLHQASLPHLTIKTAFLIAIASGQRRSSLQALSMDPGHLLWENSGVRLIPKASFIAKNQTTSSGSVEIFLPSLASHSSVEEDKVWCPVRTLKWYLDRTKSLRSTTDLFVTTTAPHRAASRDTVSRWLVDCIKLAGDSVLQVGPLRAHDTRALSTSWALFNGASIEQVQKAAFWANPNSFISCYLKDVVAHEASFALASLGVQRSVPSRSARVSQGPSVST